MASLVVEWRILGLDSPSQGSRTDRVEINLLLAACADSSQDQQLIHETIWQEMQIAFDMPDVKAAVHAVANALLERRSLSDAALRSIAKDTGLRTTLPLGVDKDPLDPDRL